jgi:hypothetical protein
LPLEQKPRFSVSKKQDENAFAFSSNPIRINQHPLQMWFSDKTWCNQNYSGTSYQAVGPELGSYFYQLRFGFESDWFWE